MQTPLHQYACALQEQMQVAMHAASNSWEISVLFSYTESQLADRCERQAAHSTYTASSGQAIDCGVVTTYPRRPVWSS